MKMRKIWMALALAVVLSFTVASVMLSAEDVPTSGICGAEGSDLSWSVNTDTGVLTISGTGDMADYTLHEVAPWYYYRDSVTSVVIDDGVTSVGSYAFRLFTKVTSVTVPEGVTRIGEYSFMRCYVLEEITVPSTVTTIGRQAFSFCDGLTSVNIGSGLSELAPAVFIYSGNIESITVDSANTAFYSSGNCLIETATKTLVLGCKNSVIPGEVKAIGEAAFHHCDGLTSLVIPEGVHAIGQEAFHFCYDLTEVSLPSTLTDMKDWAFACCTGLTEIRLPEGLITMGQYVFYYCPGLKSVVIPDGVFKLETNAFYFCSGLESVSLPSRLVALKSGVFENCESLESISFSNPTTSIGASAVPKGAVIYGHSSSTAQSYAKANGHSFVSFPGGTLDNGMTWSITAAGDLLISGSGAMGNYTETTMPWYEYRTAVRSVTVGKGITTVGKSAFQNFTALTAVHLPTTLTTVAENAFNGCSALTSVEIPASVTTVKTNAFLNCSSLKDIYFLSATTALQQYKSTISATATIYGYRDSTAAAYAETYGRTFKLLPQIAGVGRDGLSWEIDREGELIISGKGEMADYEGPTAPWASSEGGFESFDQIAAGTYLNNGVLADYGAFPAFHTNITGDSYFRVVNEGGRTFIRKVAQTTPTLTLFDTTGFMDRAPFVISFDYRMESKPNNGGILALNNRDLGETDEMRILSTNAAGTVVFGEASSGVTLVKLDYNNPVWVNFLVVVDPATYNYTIYVNGVKTLYTTGSAGSHKVWLKGSDGSFNEKAINTNSQSPFTNANGTIRSVYMFHYGGTQCGFDNLLVRPVENVNKVTIKPGVTGVGANAFAYNKELTQVTLNPGVTSVGENAFYLTGLESIEIPSATVEIYDSANTIPAGTTVRGIAGSGAETHAQKYGLTFEDLGYVASGMCGEAVVWTLTEDGTLTIFGEGEMGHYNLNTALNTAPWNAYRSKIRSVVVESGVTSVGDYAFCDYTTIQSVLLPEGLKSIGVYSFAGCTGLTEIALPQSLESIGLSCFSGCSKLKGISVPSNVTKIGEYAFQDCTSLESVVLPDGLQSIGIYAFSGCSALKSISLPSMLESIGNRAFYNCKLLEEIVLPASVKQIGEWAFASCSKLTEIAFPEGLTRIGHYAFSGCTALVSIAIPQNVSYIGAGAFAFGNLEEIQVSEDNTAYHSVGNCLIETATGALIAGGRNSIIPNDGSVTSIGSSAFFKCTGLTSITLPDGLTSIGSKAFQGCTALTDITFPEGLLSIDTLAFQGCNGLVAVTLPESLTSLGQSAFGNCGGLASITFLSATTTIYDNSSTIFTGVDIIYGFAGSTAEAYATKYNRTFVEIVDAGTCGDNLAWILTADGVLTISGEGAMANYTSSSPAPWYEHRESITSVVFVNGVTSVGDYAFSDCTAMTSTKLPETLNKIGTQGFYNCGGMTSITLPDGVENIGNWAFANCVALTEINLHEGLTNIGSYAFSGCTAIKSITVPKSVTSIGDAAFNCGNLEEIKVADGNTAYRSAGNCLIDVANRILLVGCKNSTIPDDGSVTAIGILAFHKCAGLTSITLPESVTSIGVRAFKDCADLTSIELSEGLLNIGQDAFGNCYGLVKVTLPESLTTIENNAFSNCSGLESITFLSSTTTIYDGSNTIYKDAKIYGHPGSTAEAYATKYGRTFVSLVEKCGDELTWELSEDGKLVIGGTGDMYDFGPVEAPWVKANRVIYLPFDDMAVGEMTVDTLNNSGNISGFTPTIKASGVYHVVEQGGSKYLSKTSTGASPISLLDSNYSLDSGRFVVSFDYRLTSKPSSSGILSLNDRTGGDANEMRILSIQTTSDGALAQILFGEANASRGVAILDNIDYNNPVWYHFDVVVDPETYDYEIWIDGVKILYTVTDAEASSGHIVYRREANGTYKARTMGVATQSPFSNLDGHIKGIYLLHTCKNTCDLDNLFVTFTPKIRSITVGEGVTGIGANAFRGCYDVTSITLPESMERLGDGALYLTNVTDVELKSRTATVYDSIYTIPETAKIWNYRNTAVQAYAEKYGHAFGDYSLLASGQCGDDLFWSLYDDGELVISGTGEMYDYESEEAPWLTYLREANETVNLETFDKMTEGALTSDAFGGIHNTKVTVGGSQYYSIAAGSEGDNYLKRAGAASNSGATLYFDCTDGETRWLENGLFEIEFDYRMDGTPNNSGILAINNRKAGDTDEMRILSAWTGKTVVFAGNGSIVLTTFSTTDPQWVHFRVIVNPFTYDYEIYVDGVRKLYTEVDPAATEGHTVHYMKTDGTWGKSSGTFGNQSPFKNVNGTLKGIYMFHYSKADCSIDNLAIRQLPSIRKVTLEEGVESIGAYAFSRFNIESIELPESLKAIGEGAFLYNDLDKITLNSTDISLAEHAATLPERATVYGYLRSTAHSYATAYGRKFVAFVVASDILADVPDGFELSQGTVGAREWGDDIVLGGEAGGYSQLFDRNNADNVLPNAPFELSFNAVFGGGTVGTEPGAWPLVSWITESADIVLLVVNGADGDSDGVLDTMYLASADAIDGAIYRVNADEWFNVRMAINPISGVATVYINGVYVGAVSLGGAVTSTAMSVLRFGAEAGALCFDYAIDDLGVRLMAGESDFRTDVLASNTLWTLRFDRYQFETENDGTTLDLVGKSGLEDIYEVITDSEGGTFGKFQTTDASRLDVSLSDRLSDGSYITPTSGGRYEILMNLALDDSTHPAEGSVYKLITLGKFADEYLTVDVLGADEKGYMVAYAGEDGLVWSKLFAADTLRVTPYRTTVDKVSEDFSEVRVLVDEANNSFSIYIGGAVAYYDRNGELTRALDIPMAMVGVGPEAESRGYAGYDRAHYEACGLADGAPYEYVSFFRECEFFYIEELAVTLIPDSNIEFLGAQVRRATESFDIRLVAALDDLYMDDLGFRLEVVENGEVIKEILYASCGKKVYTSMGAGIGNRLYAYECAEGDYFAALIIEGVDFVDGAADDAVYYTFRVTPYTRKGENKTFDEICYELDYSGTGYYLGGREVSAN